MVIQWLGQSCFKISSGEITLVTDPFNREIGLTPPRFRADVVTVSHKHYDHSNSESLTGEPFVIAEAGEYEVKGIYIQGIESFHDKSQGKERGRNTIFKIELEDLTIVHMGDFGEQGINDNTLDTLGDVDILMIPVGGKYTIDGEEAAKLVKKIEPRLVIPMHYKIPGLDLPLDGVELFLKESGASKKEPQEKLTLKKKDLSEEEKTEVVVLKPV